ncbi:MAG: TolC family protein [Lachnospiraceae bacterium]|nr:TolC family protein [Lachnospiraceae bacterium]
MRKSKYIKLFALCISVSLTFTSFADLNIIEYFNELRPQTHINKLYTNERKDELKKNVVNYNDIEDMIHLYNPDILNNWNSWENNKSSQDVYDEYQDAADVLYDSAGSQDSDMQEGMMMAQGRAMQIQADKNADDSYTNFLSNYLTEMQLVLATKVLDINYQKSSYELLSASESVKEAERKIEKAENALKYGAGTEVELLTAKKAVADAKSSLIVAESSQKTYKRKLLLNCGKMSSEDIYISPIDVSNDLDISNINLNNDYQMALAHNIQYEIYRRKIENARTDEVKNEFKILYESAPEKIYNDLENKYRNILDAIDTNQNRQIAYNLANDNLKKAQNEYEHGNISAKELKTAEYNVLIAGNNIQTAKYDLKIAVENYKYAVMGYSDC